MAIKIKQSGVFSAFSFRLPVGMSRSPALLFDSKQHVCQSFLWYGTLGLVSPHRQTHKCLNSIQKKATVRCLLFCIHDCYADTMHTNICSVAHTYTSIMCDYKIKLKTRGGDFLWFLTEFTYMLTYTATWEWIPQSSFMWLRYHTQLWIPVTTVSLI